MSVESLKNKKHLYYELLIDIKQTIEYLKSAKNCVSSATALKNYYIIDNEPCSKIKNIEDLENNTEKTIEYLTTNVIPWIERKIKKLGNQIDDAMKEDNL